MARFPPRHYIVKDGDSFKVFMVLGGPSAKSDQCLIKLNLHSFEQMKKYSELYSGFSSDLCWLYAVGTVR